MLKIRLQRIGKKNDPSFKVVVIEHTRGPKSGDFLERVGFHNPKTKEQSLDADRIKHWLSVGAQPSGTVHNMLVSAGIIKADKINVLPQKSPVVKEEEPKEEEKKEEKTEDEEEASEAKDETSDEDVKEEEPKEEPAEQPEEKKEE